MKKCLAFALLLVACSSTTRGPVEVQAYSKREGFGVAADALVVFEDVDGTTNTTHTDGAGHATGQVEAGGTVWLLEDAPPTQSPGPWMTAYTDVEPGDSITIGPPAVEDHAVKATMHIVGDVPPDSGSLRASAICSAVTTGPSLIAFDERCRATTDVLLMAAKVVGGVSGTVLVKYIWLPSVSIVDGGAITIDANAWRSPDDMPMLSFSNASGPVQASATSTLTGLRDGSGRTALVGPLSIHGTVSQSQSFSIFLPATAITTTIDLGPVLTPTVSVDRTSSGAVQWSIANDAGGKLVADALAISYRWTQPQANYDLTLQVDVYSPPSTSGVIDYPRLPEQFSKYQPSSDLQISKTGTLVRSTGVDADPRRVAELELGNEAYVYRSLTGIANASIATTPIQ